MSTERWQLRAPSEIDERFWARWDAMNARTAESHPLLSSIMVRCLLAHFPQQGLLVGALERRGELVGAAVVRRVARGKWTVYCPSQSPLGLILLDVPDADRVQALRALAAALPGLALVVDLPLQDAPYSPGAVPVVGAIECEPWGMTIGVRCDGGFPAYWAARSKDLRKNIRRYGERALADGLEPRLVRIDAGEALASAVDRYGLLESRGWKGAEGTALHPDNVQGIFYRDLLGRFAADNRASVYELYLGERLAAARLVIAGGPMVVILKTTYDESLKNYAPGRLHLYRMLEELAGSRVGQSVEFYTRANPDTRSWATHERPIVNGRVYRSSAVAGILGLVRQGRRLLRPPRTAPPPQELPGAGSVVQDSSQ